MFVPQSDAIKLIKDDEALYSLTEVRIDRNGWFTRVNIRLPLGFNTPIMAPMAQMIGLESLAFRRHNENINTPSFRVRQNNCRVLPPYL